MPIGSIDTDACGILQGNPMRLRTLPLVLLLSLGAGLAIHASDWPEWRGPSRDGRSAETKLPERWSPTGENLARHIAERVQRRLGDAGRVTMVTVAEDDTLRVAYTPD